jgi:hypothetical protein
MFNFTAGWGCRPPMVPPAQVELQYAPVHQLFFKSSNFQITVVRLKLGNKTLYLIFNWLDKDKLVYEKAAPMYFK